MRRLPIIALAVCLMTGLVVSSHAVTVSSQTVSASYTINEDGSVSGSVAMRNMSGTGTPTAITWSSVTLSPVTNWKIADQYLELTSNITRAGGVQIYTQNTVSSANPRFQGSTATISAAGLVAVEAPTDNPLPMCWRITDTRLEATAGYVQHPEQGTTVGAKSYPDRIWDNQGGTSNEYPCYFWMEDKSNPDFNVVTSTKNVVEYRTVKDERGIQHAEATFAGGAPSPDIIYLGAKFTNAIGRRTYRTNNLIVEVYQD